MLQTRVTRLLGTRYPIVGGCMMSISGPDFVAAISNAGALGMMASPMFETRQAFRDAIRRVRELTDQPFGINLSLFPSLRPIDNNLYADVILEEGVRVVETSGNRPPEELVARLKAGGVTTMHKCSSVRHALSAQAAGVDAVTVFGSEGGGSIGALGLATMVLVPRAAEELEIPVLAAGGIADGRGLLAALALGAEGVTIGTRLLLTEECPIHPNLKQALLRARETDTVTILATLHNTMRAWKNAAALKIAELEAQEADVWQILALAAGMESRRMYETGEIDSAVIACSQAVGLVREIKPVAEVIREIVEGAEAALQQLTGG